jgi:uncharacterized SAM-dependent methyltransferase
MVRVISGGSMNFLLVIKLRQEAARKYNPVRETKKFERNVTRRLNRRFLFNKALRSF